LDSGGIGGSLPTPTPTPTVSGPSADVHPVKAIPLHTVVAPASTPAPGTSRSGTDRHAGRNASRDGPSPTAAPAAAPTGASPTRTYSTNPGSATKADRTHGTASREATAPKSHGTTRAHGTASREATAPEAAATEAAATSTTSRGDRVWIQREKHCNDPKSGNDSRFPVAHFIPPLFLAVFHQVPLPGSLGSQGQMRC
jgi:hypothetical protein